MKSPTESRWIKIFLNFPNFALNSSFQRCFLASVAFVLVASVAANDLSCPPNSKGSHPKCICADDLPYDEINRICATNINANLLLAKCPKGTSIMIICV